MCTYMYAGMGFVDIIAAVARGLRPELPAAAVAESNVVRAAVCADSMQQSLQGNSLARPSFADLVTQLSA